MFGERDKVRRRRRSFGIGLQKVLQLLLQFLKTYCCDGVPFHDQIDIRFQNSFQLSDFGHREGEGEGKADCQSSKETHGDLAAVVS
jgi:hypothetical protein